MDLEVRDENPTWKQENCIKLVDYFRLLIHTIRKMQKISHDLSSFHFSLAEKT